MKSKTKVAAVFLFAALLISITGCDQKQNGESINMPSAGIAIPRLITQAALPTTGTLRAQLYLDGSTTPIAENLDVNKSAAAVSFSVEVASGDHSFTIKFSYIDPVFSGPWELASATKSIPVEVGVSNPLDFAAGDFTYPDSDNDGLTNLAELDSSMGTDPGNGSCIQDKSVLGGPNIAGCKLG